MIYDMPTFLTIFYEVTALGQRWSIRSTCNLAYAKRLDLLKKMSYYTAKSVEWLRRSSGTNKHKQTNKQTNRWTILYIEIIKTLHFEFKILIGASSQGRTLLFICLILLIGTNNAIGLFPYIFTKFRAPLPEGGRGEMQQRKKNDSWEVTPLTPAAGIMLGKREGGHWHSGMGDERLSSMTPAKQKVKWKEK